MRTKKLLSSLVAFAMMLGTMIMPAYAETAVAKVGGVEYATIAEALTEAADGDTVTLLASVEFTGQNAADKLSGKVIDLNSKTMTLSGNTYLTKETTIKNGDIVVTGAITDSYLCLHKADTKLTLDNVNLTGTFDAYAVLNASAGGTLDIIDSTIDVVGDISNPDGMGNIIYGGNVTIDKSTVKGDNTVRGIGLANVEISNGSVVEISNVETGLNCSTVIIDASTVTIKNATKRAVRLQDDTLTLSNNAVLTATDCAEGIISIGTTDAVILDSTSALNAESEVEVTIPSKPVATVDGEEFTDIQEAIVAAAPDGTVEIIDDVVVDEWIMISQRLSIGSGQIITLDMNGLTIKGNGKTLTVNSVESATNGDRLFHEADNLNIENLTINYADGVVGGISLKSGELKDVTINGGVGVFPGTGDITITGCEFNTNGSAIYNEEARDNLVVTDNTFNTAAGQYAIYLRGSTIFTNNTVVNGKVNVVSGSPVVTGNDFGNERFKVYNEATATIEDNTINVLAFNDNSEVKSAFAKNTLSEEAKAVLDAADFAGETVLVQTKDINGNVLGEYADFESALAVACADNSGVARIEILSDITQSAQNPGVIYNIAENQNLTIGVPNGEEYTIDISRNGSTFSIYMKTNNSSLTIGEGLTIKGLNIVADGFVTSNNELIINGTLYALSLKEWTSNNGITINETGKVVLGYGDGQFDLAYGNGYVTINGNGDTSEPQFKAGYSGTRGNGNTLNLNDTYFEGGAWFEVNGSNGTFNVDNSILKVSGGDGAGSLTVASTGNTINLTNGSTLDVANLTLGANNELAIDGTSQVKAAKLTGNGTITIDAATLTAESTPIVGDASEFTGSIELINNDELEAEIDDNGNIVLVEATTPAGPVWNGETIASVEDFIAFAKASQGGESFSGKTIKLTADIDFEGANYLEIAEDGTVVTDYRIPKFGGTFDGDGHTIKNFNFVVKDCGKHSIMMFSQDNMWAYIRNLNIENVTVNVADISGQTRITALANLVNAGGMTDAAIKNVHVKNFKIVSNNTTSGDLRIGVLAYFVQGSQLIAKDCSIDGFEVDVNEALLVGGAVAVVKSKCDFENVDVKNAVFNIDNFGSSGVIGGFVGQTQDKGTGTTFTDCDVEVEMTLGSAESLIGGFVGSIGSVSQFYNCTTKGSITVKTGEGAPASIGGFSGDLGWNGMYEPNVQHEFNNCVADVDITAVNANVGGFIGASTVTGYPKRYMPTYFNGCEAKGDVKTVTGAAGGFVGTGDRGIFNDCSASGDVEGRIAGGFWGEIYPKAEAESTGGWSYDNKVVTHTDPNSKSIVLEGATVTGTVTGTEYEAGLIGFMKDIYVNADDTLGYATPIVMTNNSTNDYNRYSYPAPEGTVAKIGNDEFDTLAKAVDAAQDGDTITLLSDVEMTNPVVISGKSLILDLGEYTICDNSTSVLTSSDDIWGLIALENGAKLTICGNGTIDCNYEVVSGGWTGMAYCIDVDATSELTVNGGNFVNGNGGIQTLGKVTVNGGTFVSHNGGTCIMALRETANVTVNDGIFKDSVEESDVYTGSGAVWSGFGATVTINGGTYDFAADPSNNNVVWTLFPAQNAIEGLSGQNANMTVTGGTFINFNPATDVVVDYSSSVGFTFGSVVADEYAALESMDGKFFIGAKPTATVNDLGKLNVTEYSVWNGSLVTGAGEMPLNFVMQFVADQNEEDMETSPYAKWYADFVITVSGLENGSFVADGCYLAGYYEPFGWVKVPIDGMTIEQGVRYPVMLGVGLGQNYEYICSGVKDFRCAMFLTEEVLAQNPNLKVNLELAVVDNSEGATAAAAALQDPESTKVLKVESIEYTAEDFEIKKFVAQIGDVQYESLEEALKAATDGCTITLLDDITVSELWDCRNTGAKFTVPVTIDGNEHTLKLTGAVEDKNWNTVFRFEADATVKNLTIDVSEATGVQRGISAKSNIVVDNCNIIGNGTSAKRAVIFGEGAGTAISDVTATITNSNFTNWSYGVSDNQSGKDAKSVSITDSTFTNASVLVSASETVTFTGNTVADGYVNITSYTAADTATVVATGNNLVGTDDEITVNPENITADDSFITPVAKIGSKYYESLSKAIEKAKESDIVTLVSNIVLDAPITIEKIITLDLNGKTITGTDNATGSFALIEIQPDAELIITDTSAEKSGKITLTSINNRGWNAYSSVISNQRGKLTVNGGTIEHLGGTDMAYGIDNLTNTGAQNAETIINGGTVKSTYRAIRQFLNSTKAQNILTVNGGTIEGANKSIWMQDANTSANPGTLAVTENATLIGDVYLYVTEGSTEWPVEVKIAASAVNGEVISANVPSGYEVVVKDGYYGVQIADVESPIGRPAIIRGIETKNEAGEDRYQVILFSAIDSLDYKNVGFEITVDGKTRPETTTVVYTSYVAANQTVVPSDFGAKCKYIFALPIYFSKEYGDSPITYTPFATTKTGETIWGTEKTFDKIYNK